MKEGISAQRVTIIYLNIATAHYKMDLDGYFHVVTDKTFCKTTWFYFLPSQSEILRCAKFKKLSSLHLDRIKNKD